MYTLTNLTDEQLSELLGECFAERRRRIAANLSSYGKPELPAGYSKVDCIRMYREKHNVDLFVAREVVEHYWEKL